MDHVLVDSSVWVAHFRTTNSVLDALLSADRVMCHPLIVLELACGTPPSPRNRTLGDLRRLHQAVISTTDETLELIERQELYDQGCGAVDLSLLASVLLTPGSMLWTADKNLLALASKCRVAFNGHGASDH